MLIADPSERFQLRFSEQATLLLAGFSGVQTQATARGLIMNAVAERDLYAAVAMLKAAVPDLVVGAVEVVYLNWGTMEPCVRVNVTTPEDYYVYVVAQLNERGGLLEAQTIPPQAPLPNAPPRIGMSTPCIP